MSLSPGLLADVGRQVLEDAAFLFVEPVAGRAPAAGGALLEASVDFHAPQGGRARLVVGEPLVEEIAANMLGLEPGDPAARANARDALGELLNIVGGALLVRAFGPGAPCALGQPTVAAAGPRGPDAGAVRAMFANDRGETVELIVELAGDGVGNGEGP